MQNSFIIIHKQFTIDSEYSRIITQTLTIPDVQTHAKILTPESVDEVPWMWKGNSSESLSNSVEHPWVIH